jgi:hypothetical protein
MATDHAENLDPPVPNPKSEVIGTHFKGIYRNQFFTDGQGRIKSREWAILGGLWRTDEKYRTNKAGQRETTSKVESTPLGERRIDHLPGGRRNITYTSKVSNYERVVSVNADGLVMLRSLREGSYHQHYFESNGKWFRDVQEGSHYHRRDEITPEGRILRELRIRDYHEVVSEPDRDRGYRTRTIDRGDKYRKVEIIHPGGARTLQSLRDGDRLETVSLPDSKGVKTRTVTKGSRNKKVQELHGDNDLPVLKELRKGYYQRKLVDTPGTGKKIETVKFGSLYKKVVEIGPNEERTVLERKTPFSHWGVKKDENAGLPTKASNEQVGDKTNISPQRDVSQPITRLRSVPQLGHGFSSSRSRRDYRAPESRLNTENVGQANVNDGPKPEANLRTGNTDRGPIIRLGEARQLAAERQNFGWTHDEDKLSHWNLVEISREPVTSPLRTGSTDHGPIIRLGEARQLAAERQNFGWTHDEDKLSHWNLVDFPDEPVTSPSTQTEKKNPIQSDTRRGTSSRRTSGVSATSDTSGTTFFADLNSIEDGRTPALTPARETSSTKDWIDSLPTGTSAIDGAQIRLLGQQPASKRVHFEEGPTGLNPPLVSQYKPRSAGFADNRLEPRPTASTGGVAGTKPSGPGNSRQQTERSRSRDGFEI